MLVRAKCTHFKRGLRKEGDEFEHSGPLYAHIEPVKPKGKPTNADVQAAADKAAAEGKPNE